MIRFILCIIVILALGIYSIFDAIVCMFINDEQCVREHSHKIVKNAMNIVLKISGVKLVVSGIENYYELSKETGIFIISNHRGYFDVLSGYVTLNRDLSIIAKAELKKLPIVGYWMQRIGCLFLDRNNLRSGANMVVNAIELINNHKSVWVFPEGTRNKNKEVTKLLDFKPGTFKIPEKTNCYVLPMVILNSDQVFENQFPILKPTTVYIAFGKAYRISELNDDDRNNIAEFNKELMIQVLTKLQRTLKG